jgi:hypothetical protein
MEACGEYLVSHGNGGAVGRFTAPPTLTCQRGDRVVVHSARGQEVGVVLCPATTRHARLLGTPTTGELLRRTSPGDEELIRTLRVLGERLFADGRRLAAELGLPFEILDVEVLFDGQRALVQHLRWAECDSEPFARALGRAYGLEVLLEDLAVPEPAEEHGGCGQPGCGRAEGGGGCSSCGSGGCSSCGSGKVDMTAYFAHLRTKMEQHQRVPLL